MSATLETLETPAAIIDVARMQRNIQRMQARMNTLGVRLRPHVKTSKCLPVIQAQIAAGATGVTVSTLKEAEYCFANGITDVLYAVAMAPGKLPQALALIRQGCRLGIITDSVAGAQAIVAFGQQHDECFEVWIEIDSDGHRSGIKVDDPALLQVAQVLCAGIQHQLAHAIGSGIVQHRARDMGVAPDIDERGVRQVLAGQQTAHLRQAVHAR